MKSCRRRSALLSLFFCRGRSPKVVDAVLNAKRFGGPFAQFAKRIFESGCTNSHLHSTGAFPRCHIQIRLYLTNLIFSSSCQSQILLRRVCGKTCVAKCSLLFVKGVFMLLNYTRLHRYIRVTTIYLLKPAKSDLCATHYTRPFIIDQLHFG